MARPFFPVTAHCSAIAAPIIDDVRQHFKPDCERQRRGQAGEEPEAGARADPQRKGDRRHRKCDLPVVMVDVARQVDDQRIKEEERQHQRPDRRGAPSERGPDRRRTPIIAKSIRSGQAVSANLSPRRRCCR